MVADKFVAVTENVVLSVPVGGVPPTKPVDAFEVSQEGNRQIFIIGGVTRET